MLKDQTDILPVAGERIKGGKVWYNPGNVRDEFRGCKMRIREERLVKSLIAGAVVGAVGYISYGDVAPTWVMAATYIVAALISLLVYFIDPTTVTLD